MRVAIVGSGLAGLSAAVDLVDAGHEVNLYEARPFMGGKVGSWVDEGGNHIERWGCTFSSLITPTSSP